MVDEDDNGKLRLERVNNSHISNKTEPRVKTMIYFSIILIPISTHLVIHINSTTCTFIQDIDILVPYLEKASLTTPLLVEAFNPPVIAEPPALELCIKCNANVNITRYFNTVDVEDILSFLYFNFRHRMSSPFTPFKSLVLII